MTDKEKDAQLTEEFKAPPPEPQLIICLETNLFTGWPVARLMKPGKTARSVPVKALSHVIVAEDGETSADMLIRLGEAMKVARAV